MPSHIDESLLAFNILTLSSITYWPFLWRLDWFADWIWPMHNKCWSNHTKLPSFTNMMMVYWILLATLVYQPWHIIKRIQFHHGKPQPSPLTIIYHWQAEFSCSNYVTPSCICSQFQHSILHNMTTLPFLAFKQTGQSFLNIQDNGMILDPTNSICIGTYVDSYFAGPSS